MACFWISTGYEPTLPTMDYIIISIAAILVLALFVSILLINFKTSNNIKLQGKTLTVWHPLKKEIINLEKDLKRWNIRRMNLLWRGKLYALTLKLKGGAGKKIYFRSRTGKIRRLVGVLEELAPEGKSDS